MQGRMSGGGGCCIARYTHNHGPTQTYYNPYHLSKIDNIMLRFRPIAPKPVPGGPTQATSPNKNDTVRKGKRKNSTTTTTTGGKCNKKGRKALRSPDNNTNHPIKSTGSPKKYEGCKVTLPLLPETPDLSPTQKTNPMGQTKSIPKWLCFGPSDKNDLTAVEVVESSVIIEAVTDKWLDGNGLGCTDEERRVRLDEDTCPGFISDGWNQVWWTNKAYGKMVTGEDYTWQKERVMVVKLTGMKEKVDLPTVKLFPAFTCRVKVVYGKQSTMTVPCDVWRMNGGGFAWRLDTKAALSLGR